MNTYVWKNWEIIKYAVNFDDQQQYKASLEASMVSTTEGLTGNITMDVGK